MSPCGSHVVPLVGSSVVDVSICVREGTFIWFRIKREGENSKGVNVLPCVV